MSAALPLRARDLPPQCPDASRPADRAAYLGAVAAGLSLREFLAVVGCWVAANYVGAEDATVCVGFGIGNEPSVLPVRLG